MIFLIGSSLIRGTSLVDLNLNLTLTSIMTCIKANAAIFQQGRIEKIKEMLNSDVLNQFNKVHVELVKENKSHVRRVITVMGILYYLLSLNIAFGPLLDSLFSGNYFKSYQSFNIFISE